MLRNVVRDVKRSADRELNVRFIHMFLANMKDNTPNNHLECSVGKQNEGRVENVAKSWKFLDAS